MDFKVLEMLFYRLDLLPERINKLVSDGKENKLINMIFKVRNVIIKI